MYGGTTLKVVGIIVFRSANHASAAFVVVLRRVLIHCFRFARAEV